MQGFKGQLSHNAKQIATESMVLEKSNAPFGVIVVSDTDGLCRLPDKLDVLGKGVTTGVAVGVLIREKGKMNVCDAPLAIPIGNGDKEYYKEKDIASILREGVIFVQTETDVKRNDAIYYRIEKTAENPTLGSIRNNADTAKAVKLNGAVFLASAKVGEMVEIAVNLNVVQETY